MASLPVVTGNFIFVTLVHMMKMINKAIVRDFGHFDSAIDLACLEGLEGMNVDCTKPQSIFSSSPLVTVRSCWLQVTPLAIIPCCLC